MGNKWKCIGSLISFTKGKVYKEDSDGRLIDDDGDQRLWAESYAGYFEKYKPTQMENK